MSLLSIHSSSGVDGVAPTPAPRPYGLTPEQLELRKDKIGSSEIAALIPPLPDGTPVHPHGRGPMDVFAAKNGADRPSTAEQRWGQVVERAILQMHFDTSALTELPHPGTLVHPKYPWLCLTPDAIARDHTGRRRHIEAKNSGRWMTHLWGAEGTGEVPMGYAAQCQVTLDGLLALGLVDDDQTELAACIGGMPPAPYVIDHRPHLVEQLAELARVFVEKHLKTGIPPEQGWDSDAAERWLRVKYPTSADPLLVATEADVKLARQIGYAKKRLKKWERVEDEGKNRLRKRIGPAEGIAGIATNKCRKDGTRVLLLAKEWSAK